MQMKWSNFGERQMSTVLTTQKEKNGGINTVHRICKEIEIAYLRWDVSLNRLWT